MIKVMHIITTLGPAGAENMLCRIAAGMDRTRFENEIRFADSDYGSGGADAIDWCSRTHTRHDANNSEPAGGNEAGAMDS